MDKQQQVQFRQQLQDLRTELQADAEASQQASATVELDQSRQGRLSRMDAMQGQAMSQATQQLRQRQLQQIEAALQRIEAGEYGECLHCGKAIATARLTLNPATPLCIECAEQ